jgi:hypothetical protein
MARRMSWRLSQTAVPRLGVRRLCVTFPGLRIARSSAPAHRPRRYPQPQQGLDGNGIEPARGVSLKRVLHFADGLGHSSLAVRVG